MSKRKWTDMKQYEGIILRMVSEGGTRKSIAATLELEPEQIKNFMHRYRANQRKIEPPKKKGRPRSRPLTTSEEYEQEIARLQMENKLLRDFLQSVERM